MTFTFPHVDTVPNSELLARVRLSSGSIIAKIHHKYALEIDQVIVGALEKVNSLRRRERNELGHPLREHFSAVRYRIIASPLINNATMELHLAPIDFAYWALLKDKFADDAIKTYVHEKIIQIASNIDSEFKADHPHLNGFNQVPLGVEVVIITSDGRTLLRKRGMSVLTEANDWDVSFSGYCGASDVVDGVLDLGLSAVRELRQEIGALPANAQNVVFTGLHRNASNGSIDLLGFWKIDTSSKELLGLVSEKDSDEVEMFATTKRAPETFVWDTKNLLVQFNQEWITKTFDRIGVSLYSFTSEALVCLLLALESAGQS